MKNKMIINGVPATIEMNKVGIVKLIDIDNYYIYVDKLDPYGQKNNNKDYIEIVCKDGTQDGLCKMCNTFNGNVTNLGECLEIMISRL